MAVRIRLTRVGATKRPAYRVVAIDRRRSRDGRALEILGYYDPLTEPATVQLETDKIQAWIGKGAQPSDTVLRLMRLSERASAGDATAEKPKRATRSAAAKPSKKAQAKAAAAADAAEAPAEPAAAEEASETETPAAEAAATPDEATAEEPEAAAEEAPTAAGAEAEGDGPAADDAEKVDA